MTSSSPHINSEFKNISSGSISVGQSRDGTILTIKDLSVNRPDGSLLIKPFSLTLNAGERLMISGPSGCGKSTIVRAAHGIWPWGSGSIEIDEDIKQNDRKLIIAQKPHLPLISLKGIVCFPRFLEKFTDDAVAAAMEQAGLEKFIPEMNDSTKDGGYWSTLSGGEQQRISFARIFLHKPSLLMLDEVTASLDVKAQDELYSTLLEVMPDCTLISISHRMELADYHTRHAVIENQSFVQKLPEALTHPRPESQCPNCYCAKPAP